MRLSLLFTIFALFSFQEVCKAASVPTEELIKNAQAGDANSQYTLAKKYCIGRGVERDFNEAAKWFTMAAQQGSVKAQYELGTMYENGQGVAQNFSQAFQWYTKAAQKDYAKAQHSLGLFYSLGAGIGRDYNQAIEWFTKAAQQGLSEAQLDLGLMYFKGQGVERNSGEAAKWFNKAAAQGNADAQYYLGVLSCKRDEENENNYKEAARWFTKAAAQGQAKAQYILGVMYSKGEGVPQDYRTAAKWLTKAASQGLSNAQLILAACYWTGRGVPEDYVESYKWLLLAGMNGDKDAKWLKKELREKMTAGQIEEAQMRVNKVRKIKGYLAEKEKGAKNNSQPMENIESTSTGFLITSDGFILTAYHSVGKSENVQVVYNQKQYTAKVIDRNESIDAAILKIDGNDFSYLPITSSTSVQTGDTVFTMGYPQVSLQGTEPKFTEGSISSLSGLADNPQFFQISVPVQPGNSGGPLINKKGEVVGLIVARLNDVAALLSTGAVPQNVNFALKSSFILPFIESVPDLSQKIAANSLAKDRSIAIERAKKSVVLITSHK